MMNEREEGKAGTSSFTVRDLEGRTGRWEAGGRWGIPSTLPTKYHKYEQSREEKSDMLIWVTLWK